MCSVLGDRYKSHYILLHAATQLGQHHLLKCSFSPGCTLGILPTDACKYMDVSGSSILSACPPLTSVSTFMPTPCCFITVALFCNKTCFVFVFLSFVFPIFYLFVLTFILFKREKGHQVGCVERGRGAGRSWRRRKCDQNILCTNFNKR